jgi:hypothetical protein
MAHKGGRRHRKFRIMVPSVLFEYDKIMACRLAVHNVSSIGSNDERDFW